MLRKILCLLLALFCLAGCSILPHAQTSVNHAMYVPLGDNSYVMVDDNGSVYTVTFPEDMEGLHGESITQADLTAGNRLEIYGDGIMAESYPGQYFGVTRIVVTDQGDPQDIEQYRSLIDEFSAPPTQIVQLNEPPIVHLEYAVSGATAYTQLNPGNFNWQVDNGDGTANAIIACGAPVLQWPNLRNVRISAETTLHISSPDLVPDQVSCTRWPASQYGSADVTVSAQDCALTAHSDGSYTLSSEPDYIYCLNISWSQGAAEYGFITAAQLQENN